MDSDAKSTLFIHQYIRNLEWDLIRIQNSESQSDELLARNRYITKRIRRTKSLLHLIGEEFVSNPLLVNGANFTFADLQLKLPIRRPFQNDLVQPLESGRYLCLSVGYAVYCIDLKLQSSEDLPIISTMNLLEEVSPISMGVFKIGSCVYMIAGKEVPYPAKQLSSCCHEDMTYEVVYAKYGVEGTSRETYRVSLADGRLSLYEGGIIPPLNKTKYWPIVEIIDNHLHVIDSIPNCHYGYHVGKTREFSHEVLDLNDIRRGWTELSHSEHLKSVLDTHISQYIVVGDRIYADFYAVDPACDAHICLSFDSKTKNWEEVEVEVGDEVLHVSQVFGFGIVGCAVAGVLCEELKDRYDVLFLVGRKVASVCILDKSGYVVCYNPLPKFFDKVETNFRLVDTKVMAVDEEGSTLCVILELNRHSMYNIEEVYFISTFSFKEVYKVEPGLWSSDGELVEIDFMELKQECYMYNKGSTLKDNVVLQRAVFF